MRIHRTSRAALPDGTRSRLTDHYGPEINGWLDEAQELVADLARDWNLTVLGFHDAGWTSVIAVCQKAGQKCVLKLTPDARRFERERAALAHWRDKSVCQLLRVDPVWGALLLQAVGGTPGGTPRPEDHARRVAATLPELHAHPALPDAAVPLFAAHQSAVVRPRIQDRLRRLAHGLDDELVEAVHAVDMERMSSRGSLVMLHADLYAENIPFDSHGQPVFIDPHPMRGPAAYDWAFWCVYYTVDGFERRLDLCGGVAAVPMDEVVAHAAVLALDGYLYYLDTKDPRAGSIREALHVAVHHALAGARR
ncbi:MAG: hypothetical protein GEU94_09935 [Micromonosporaceae bacterium]|nr:hypothetical protein [Micromonosporaceae bacterium]